MIAVRSPASQRRCKSSVKPKLKARIIKGLRVLQENPYEARPGADIVRLRGTRGRQDLFRLRIGDYRAVTPIFADRGHMVELVNVSLGLRRGLSTRDSIF
jgi:mRNA interferase RelE/StbE